MQDVNITSNINAKISKAVVWVSSIDGEAFTSNVFVGAGPPGAVGLLMDDGPTGTGVTGFWNMEMFHDVWVGMGPDAYGVKIVCSSLGGSSLVSNGGAVVDANTSNVVAMMTVDGGSQGSCQVILVNNPYFELCRDKSEIIYSSSAWRTSARTRCSSTEDQASLIAYTFLAMPRHLIRYILTGGMCTNVINNEVAGNIFNYTTNGAIKYDWERVGSQWIH